MHSLVINTVKAYSLFAFYAELSLDDTEGQNGNVPDVLLSTRYKYILRRYNTFKKLYFFFCRIAFLRCLIRFVYGYSPPNLRTANL